MCRYKLIQKDIKFLADKKKGAMVNPIEHSSDPIFVDILEVDGDWAKLKLYYSNGKIVVGWTWHWEILRPVEIHEYDQLFDGRFNS